MTRPLAITNAYWAALIIEASSDDQMMKAAWSYLLACFAKNVPESATLRDERRREVAIFLVEMAERP